MPASMGRNSGRIPGYCLHRASGQAVVTIDGRDLYLGRHGAPASRQEYDRLIAAWLAAGRTLPAPGLTIEAMVNGFRRHAQERYTVPSTLANFEQCLRFVLELYAATAAAAFSPLCLKRVRQLMIDQGLARSSINRHVSRIRGVFRWAAENELVPSSVPTALDTVAGLRAGASKARETDGVKPVPLSNVHAALPHMPPRVATMVRLQLLSGMRPGEVVIMRGCDLDMSGEVWVYRPPRHKTRYLGQAREIFLGPKAQDLLRPMLRRDLSAYLFPPTPRGGRRSRGHYSTASYYNAIQRAIRRACAAPDDQAPRDAGLLFAAPPLTWSIDRWHPHQLRHTAATAIRAEHGLDAAQVILGHKTLSVTQVYAERNLQQASDVMAAIG